MAKKKNAYVDNGWPTLPEDVDHAVTEFTSHLTGALSPYGDEFPLPLPASELPYLPGGIPKAGTVTS